MHGIPEVPARSSEQPWRPASGVAADPITRRCTRPMYELGNVLQEVLKALGAEGPETIGLRRSGEPGDHHRQPALDARLT